jgi:ABC-2 type transport system ATP-binding protein
MLTTQYLDEADQLASSISVIDHGRVIAEGSPEQLKSRIGGDRIDVVLHDAHDLGTAVRSLAPLAVAAPAVDEDARRVSVRVADPARGLQEVVRILDDAHVAMDDLALRRPTLDEAFLHLTGAQAEATRNEEVSA